MTKGMFLLGLTIGLWISTWLALISPWIPFALACASGYPALYYITVESRKLDEQAETGNGL
jgi:hypothetical protein